MLRCRYCCCCSSSLSPKKGFFLSLSLLDLVVRSSQGHIYPPHPPHPLLPVSHSHDPFLYAHICLSNLSSLFLSLPRSSRSDLCPFSRPFPTSIAPTIHWTPSNAACILIRRVGLFFHFLLSALTKRPRPSPHKLPEISSALVVLESPCLACSGHRRVRFIDT